MLDIVSICAWFIKHCDAEGRAEVTERPGGDWGLRKLAEMFQQVTSNFPDLRAYQDFATWAPRSALEALIDALRAGLVGRRLEVTASGRPLRLTLADIDATLDPVGASAGQAEHLALTAAEIEYDGLSFVEGVARLGNVHTRMGTQPALVCAPVYVSLEMSTDQAALFVERFVPAVVLEWRQAGEVRLRWRSGPSFCCIDVEPAVESGRVTLRPVAIGFGRWRRILRRSWRPITLPVQLPPNLRLTAAAVGSASVRVDLRIDEWRMDYQQIAGWARRSG